VWSDLLLSCYPTFSSSHSHLLSISVAFISFFLMVSVTIHVAILFNLSFVVSYVSTIKVKQLWGASSAISPTFDSVFLSSWAFVLARFEGVGVERGDVSHLSIFLQCTCLHPWTRSRGQNQEVMENTCNRSKFEEPTSIRLAGHTLQITNYSGVEDWSNYSKATYMWTNKSIHVEDFVNIFQNCAFGLKELKLRKAFKNKVIF